MAAFDPNDWTWVWFRAAERDRRRPEEINREVATRSLASAALCLCFAALGPSEHIGAALAVLLIITAVTSAGFAIIRRQRFRSRHLTAWDEAPLFSAIALVLIHGSSPNDFEAGCRSG
jgi:hypothetical protein